jgi:polyisoprenoid-binding protein YceI
LQRDAAVGVWELDSGTSVLEFRVKHFWGAVTVRGGFGTVTGRLDVAPSGIVSGTIEAAAASLDTGNATRDKHLRSAAFFDVDADTYLPTAAGVRMLAAACRCICDLDVGPCQLG